MAKMRTIRQHRLANFLQVGPFSTGPQNPPNETLLSPIDCRTLPALEVVPSKSRSEGLDVRAGRKKEGREKLFLIASR